MILFFTILIKLCVPIYYKIKIVVNKKHEKEGDFYRIRF